MITAANGAQALVVQGDIRRGISLPDESVDAIVCDPPYELGFMGRAWDRSGVAFDPATWREALRVLKPGGHLLAFGGTRTYHRIACAIEDAGFEIRDSLHWIYGSGFPKSLDVSKAIDAAAGAERKIVGTRDRYRDGYDRQNQGDRSVVVKVSNNTNGVTDVTAPATPEAAQWEGWGTALKPAHEPIIVARKPLDGTVAANVLEHGTGALNVDACRVQGVWSPSQISGASGHSAQPDASKIAAPPGIGVRVHDAGRWPPNVLLSHAPECTDAACAEGCPVAEMGEQSGVRRDTAHNRTSGERAAGVAFAVPRDNRGVEGHDDSGTAARFFPCFRYCAKASTREREAGCQALPAATGAEMTDRTPDSAGLQSPRAGAGRTAKARRNTHPTVKPIALMRWLVRLVTPPGGVVLDPFAGSGTTGIAALAEGFDFLGVELEPAHVAIAEARIAYHARKAGA